MWEIDTGELAERSDGGSVVVVSRVLGVKLCRPDVGAPPINSDARPPLSVARLDDPLVGVAAITSPLPVPEVLAVTAGAKVAPPVIEAITIDVVYKDSITGAKDDAMHHLAALFGSDRVPVAGTTDKKPPLEARKRIGINGINDGKQAIAYLDACNRFVGNNVVRIERMCGRAYAVSRRGDRVVVRYLQRRERKHPALPGVVVRFPVR